MWPGVCCCLVRALHLWWIVIVWIHALWPTFFEWISAVISWCLVLDMADNLVNVLCYLLYIHLLSHVKPCTTMDLIWSIVVPCLIDCPMSQIWLCVYLTACFMLGKPHVPEATLAINEPWLSSLTEPSSLFSLPWSKIIYVHFQWCKDKVMLYAVFTSALEITQICQPLPSACFWYHINEKCFNKDKLKRIHSDF